tara:strand:- start:1539 stop:2108 length:570 start_codon:yes stop_codon:yes gene_type:complete
MPNNNSRYKIVDKKMVDTKKEKGWKGKYNGKGFKDETLKARRVLFWCNLTELRYLTDLTDEEKFPNLKTHFQKRCIKYKDIKEDLPMNEPNKQGKKSRKYPPKSIKSTENEEQDIKRIDETYNQHYYRLNKDRIKENRLKRNEKKKTIGLKLVIESTPPCGVLSTSERRVPTVSLVVSIDDNGNEYLEV